MWPVQAGHKGQAGRGVEGVLRPRPGVQVEGFGDSEEPRSMLGM